MNKRHARGLKLSEFITIPTLTKQHPGHLLDAHCHERDARIYMDSDAHKYYIDWQNNGFFTKPLLSGSQVGKYFFRAFPRDIIAHQLGKEGKGRGKYATMNKEEVKAHWNSLRDLGSEMHLNIAAYYNKTPFPSDYILKPEIAQFLGFNEKWLQPRGLRPYRVEWMIFSDEKTGVVGTPDLVCVYEQQKETDVLRGIIVDHKRKAERPKARGFGKGPCSNMRDSVDQHDGLAVNVYRHILETFYFDLQFDGKIFKKIYIDDMVLASYHPELKEYKVTHVERTDVSDIIACALDTEIALEQDKGSVMNF